MFFPSLEVLIGTFIICLPFGYYRQGVRKFSLRWFLAIHLPVPAIYFLRQSMKLGIWVIPIALVFAVAGQILGGKLRVLFEGSFKIPAK